MGRMVVVLRESNPYEIDYFRHSDESRNLVTFKDAGFRVKHGTTAEV